MNIEKLEELGLTRNESLTYKALLEIGQTKTGAIVKKTILHRVLIYDALESLIKKGLVSYVIKENIKYFQATNPENLVEFLEEKTQNAKAILPDLKNLMSHHEGKQAVVVYEGIKGLKSVLNSMLNELTSKDEHLVIASGLMSLYIGDYYYLYQKEKKKKHILTKGICDISFKEKKDIIKATYAKIKFYPLGPFPTDTWIYKDKVLIVNYTTNPPVAILITSQETAESYKRIFEGFWKKAKSEVTNTNP